MMLNYWVGEVLGWWSADYGREWAGSIRLALLGVCFVGGVVWLFALDVSDLRRQGLCLKGASGNKQSGRGAAQGVNGGGEK